MPIDPGIYSQLQPPPAFDMWTPMLRAQQLQAGRQNLDLQKQSADVLNEQRQAATEQRQLQTAAATREQAEEQRLRALFSGDKPPSPGQVYAVVGPERGAKILQGLDALREQGFKTDDALWTNVAKVTGAITALPPAMQADGYKMARESFIAKGVPAESIPEEYSPEVVASFQKRAMSPKEAYDANQPKLHNVSPGNVVIDEKNPQGGAVFTAPAKAPDVNAGSFEDYVTRYARDVAKKPLQALTTKEIEDARQKYAAAGSTANADDSAITFTPDALDMVANQFAMTGVLPPMGMGKQGTAARAKVINRAAELYKGLDLASQKAAYESSKKSLDAMQKQFDAISSFENTATKNLDQFLATAAKIVDTGSPLVNKPLRAFAESALGSPEMAAYNTARLTVIPEFAKILNNPNLSGQLSDSARHEIEGLMKGQATLKQTVAVATILKNDVKNRHDSLSDQIKAIQTRIATPPGHAAKTDTAAPGAPTVGSTVTYQGKHYKVTAIDNGHATLEPVLP